LKDHQFLQPKEIRIRNGVLPDELRVKGTLTQKNRLYSTAGQKMTGNPSSFDDFPTCVCGGIPFAMVNTNSI